MNLRLISRVLFHLLQHLFFGKTFLTARTTRRMAFVIVMLIVGAAAELRRIWVFTVHRLVLIANPAMHQAHLSHNT